MLKGLLGFVWRKAPRSFRRWGVRLSEPRFNVTAGAVVIDDEGRVLLLKHVFRPGSGWGIPGGFLEKGEQPDEAIRRELREETGLDVETTEILFARTLQRAGRVEIIYRCRPLAGEQAAPRTFEIRSAEWFAPDRLPAELSDDQRWIIRRALNDGAETTD